MPVCVSARGKEPLVSASVKLSSLAAYFAFVAGLAGLCVSLSRHVGTQTATLALSYVVSDRARSPTLVERRQIEAGPAVAASHPEISDAPAVLEVPAVPVRVLAAGMDLAERLDLASLEPQGLRRGRSRASRTKSPTRVAAADVFGRSFGVMLMASR